MKVVTQSQKDLKITLSVIVDKEIIQAAFAISEIDWCLLAKEVAQRKFSETLPVEWKEKAKI